MPRIIVNPDSAVAWEIELKPGPNTFGRGEENDFKIAHPSVSTTHCRITVMPYRVTIKDLGSVTGTFVGTTLIEESQLAPGQMFRLGDVWMRIEKDAVTNAPAVSPAPAAEPVPLPAVPAETTHPCQSHPKALATYYCPRCVAFFCNLCIVTRMVAGQTTRSCRACGNECVPLETEESFEPPVFSRLIGGAFTFPFKHDGLMVLVGGTIFLAVMDVLLRFMFFIGIFVTIIVMGYLIAFLQGILKASAAGEERMPDWPDFTDLWEMAVPFWEFLCVQVISTGPLIFLTYLKIHSRYDVPPPWLSWAIPAAVIWGCLYFPIGFLAVTMFDSVAALNPVLIFRSIFRIPAAYLLAVLLCAAIYLANRYGHEFIYAMMPIPFVPHIFAEFLGLYIFTVTMRILGLLYWTKKDDLGWFSH